MKSPRFDARAAPLRRIFAPANIETIWRKKVRLRMREQFVNDGIEHLDFHLDCARESRKLSQVILAGDYLPGQAQRILVEKSKGLCRQLVIPCVRDAIVLQCLSDALYKEIRGNAPTNRSFFEPKEHKFSTVRSDYGTFAAWLNFQRQLFDFSKNRKFIVVTDIANYYDSISYVHLRNIISSKTQAEECVIDMLIYVLSDLLWQPDYSPRVEVGLPQMNLDAPRLLAHCFLYELDTYLANSSDMDFVRYMDDVDIGVDSVVAARKVLQSVDLVLQTRQVRLNSGKTLILTKEQGERHFRITENYRLDLLSKLVEKRIRRNAGRERMCKLIERRIKKGLARRVFDDGNGDKILKRWLTLAGKVGAEVASLDLARIVLHRPSVREKALDYVMRVPLKPAIARTLADCAESGHLVDNAGIVDVSNKLVDTLVTSRRGRHQHILRLIGACDPRTYFGLYARLWLQSKYDTTDALLSTIRENVRIWGPDDRLGRLIGAFAPLFGGAERDEYIGCLMQSRNSGFRRVFVFHERLRSDARAFGGIFNILKEPNTSRGTGITHPKFLCLLSAIGCRAVSAEQIEVLRAKNEGVARDAYYKKWLEKTGDTERFA